ncbi:MULTISPECIES: ABC transporter permease [Ramlibacter]|uniref:ABC transporter permease n=1 Tax=Ramlibacter aquaticus TaxID=2780094 RepID=A0ABR9SHY6_9BURK|nr:MULTISPECIES: ABC transporter permease [Ramlibacter]MBE7941647.1 ABC transporter permease [Ramlibacter aquaticus]
MPNAIPRLERSADAGTAAVRLLGDWTAPQLAAQRRLAQLEADWPADGVAWDLRDAEQFDHVAAQWLWDRWGQRWPEQLALMPAQRAILERVARFTVAPAPRRRATLRALYLSLGGAVLRGLDHLLAFLRLVGQLAFNLLRLVRAPHMGPWRDFTGHIYRIGAMAMPITALVGFLIGVVLAYLTAQQLRQFGADAYIVNILGIALIRELGPMLAAILIAGRSGSAITAQIGVMRVTEELDAMRVMGISHSFRLVMPRAMALAIAMPLISTWTTLASLAGGMLAADLSLDITPRFFVTQLPQAVAIGNLGLACAKSVVFGVLIALVGCHFGLRVQPNTQSLGEGTTASVVSSITVVILVDALFAVLFKNVGF